MMVPSQLNMSTSIREQTLMEECPSPSHSKEPVNHMTLRDVSAIEKEEAEMETDVLNPDLSVSLLPFITTVNPDDEKKNQNKSIRSTISDKTFVKTSLKPFSSEEDMEEDDEENDTTVEQSFLADTKEPTRPLLLTADQSIRIRDQPSRKEKISLPNKSLEEKTKIKQEKVSFREPIKIRK